MQLRKLPNAPSVVCQSGLVYFPYPTHEMKGACRVLRIIHLGLCAEDKVYHSMQLLKLPNAQFVVCQSGLACSFLFHFPTLPRNEWGV